MIPQNKIDEAAKLYSLNADTDRLQEIDDNETYDFTEYVDSAVKFGVQLALNEIQPLICEFIEEVIGDGWILRADGWQNVMDNKVPELERRTTQQLLEEFIKSKNK